MIPTQLAEEARRFVEESASKHGRPSASFLDLPRKKGRELAATLGAQEDVVETGCVFMDCMLPHAIAEGRIAEHIQMGLEKAREMMSGYPEMTDEEKENIEHCILEHHGAQKFFSIEAEICCNADCYKFLSLEGVLEYIQGNTDLSLSGLISLLGEKAEEKWRALSLPEVREELEPQYKVIRMFFEESSKAIKD